MSPENFSVSTIIPVFNGASFLAEAVESVLAQGHAPLEILVIDDGSTDETPSVAERFGRSIRYLRQENKGPSAARNLGVRAASGNFIAFLDADDLWAQDKLKNQIACFRDNPSAGIVHGYIQMMKPAGRQKGRLVFEKNGPPFFTLSLGGALIKKTVFERIGFLDETVFSAEDMNWLFRAWESGAPIIILKQVVMYYRKHAGGISYGKDLKGCNFLKEIKKSMDRRKQTGNRIPALPQLRLEEIPSVENAGTNEP